MIRTDSLAVIESIIATAPLTVRRMVRWGECDPAGVVFTSRFSDYVISAAELFYGSLFDTTPQRAKHEQGFGTPSRALSFDFIDSLRPDDVFDTVVTVESVNRRTFVLDITGRKPDGGTIFVAKLTPVCVARSERRSIDIPADFRALLIDYQASCEQAGVRTDQNPKEQS